MAKLIPDAMRTADSRPLLAQASPRRSANATSTTTTRIHDPVIKPVLPARSKATALARAVAHEGGWAPVGSSTVSGDLAAPATTAMARYPPTKSPRDHVARTDVPFDPLSVIYETKRDLPRSTSS